MDSSMQPRHFAPTSTTDVPPPRRYPLRHPLRHGRELPPGTRVVADAPGNGLSRRPERSRIPPIAIATCHGRLGTRRMMAANGKRSSTTTLRMTALHSFDGIRPAGVAGTFEAVFGERREAHRRLRSALQRSVIPWPAPKPGYHGRAHNSRIRWHRAVRADGGADRPRCGHIIYDKEKITTKREVPHPDIAGEPNGAIPVTSLEAALSSNRLSMRLSLRASGTNAKVTDYALSPPAAARLARESAESRERVPVRLFGRGNWMMFDIGISVTYAAV